MEQQRVFCRFNTPTGINASVTSAIGTVHSGGNVAPEANTVGQMKLSQQGDKLAVAIRDLGTFSTYDFDINTGAVSNEISMYGYNTAYGIEFSPDGTKLYGGQLVPGSVYQFNLSSGNATTIGASATLIGSFYKLINSIQIAPNGKIYVAKSFNQTTEHSYLDVINNPNNLPASINYVVDGLSLGTNTSLLGLPNFMVSKIIGVTPNIAITGVTSICAGQSTTLYASNGNNYNWTGGVTSTTNSVIVSPTTTTTYYASTTNACGTDVDTITVTVNPNVDIVTSNNSTICVGQTELLSVTGGSNYNWSGGGLYSY